MYIRLTIIKTIIIEPQMSCSVSLCTRSPSPPGSHAVAKLSHHPSIPPTPICGAVTAVTAQPSVSVGIYTVIVRAVFDCIKNE